MAMVVAGRSAAQKAGDVQRAFRSQSARAMLPDAFAAATVRAFEKAEMRAPTSGGIASQTTWASRALGPIAREALDLIPDAAQLPNSEWSELLFRLHGALGDPSTRLRALTEDLTAYERMAVRVRVEQTGRPSLGVPRRWWTRPGFVGGVLISFGIVVLAVVLFVKFEATRTRVQSGLAGLALAWSGIAYVVMGPLGLRPAATEDSEIDTDEGMFEAGGPPGDSTAAEVAALQAEVAQLRSGGAAPPREPHLSLSGALPTDQSHSPGRDLRLSDTSPQARCPQGRSHRRRLPREEQLAPPCRRGCHQQFRRQPQGCVLLWRRSRSRRRRRRRAGCWPRGLWRRAVGP